MYLAQQREGEPVLIAEISQKRNIPLKFLENILLELKKQGILDSKKGKGGGYYLAKAPEKNFLSRRVTIGGRAYSFIALREPSLLPAMRAM